MKQVVFNLFKDFEIYLVGGAVRDMLLNKESNDLDFATSALPSQTKLILETSGFKTHLVGWAFGTVGFISNGYEVHVTTFRRNEHYVRDNRNPVVEWGKTITEDLTRRDFTINAIAINNKGEFLDLFNGREHLIQKLLETPINADEAFSDDPLRMLRAIRFKAKLNFQYSENIKKALYNQAHRLLILPKERIVEELNKILMTDNAADALEDMFEYKLLNYIVPELIVLSKVEQESIYHHKNAWLHTCDVVRNIPNDLILRYSALFHDIGKFATFSNNGIVHFYHHEDVGAMMTNSILHRLGLPKQWIKDIVYLVKNHMRVNTYEYNWSDTAVRRFIRETNEQCDNLLALSEADITSHNPISIKKHLDCLNDLRRRIEELKSFKEIISPLNGLEIMQEFNLKPSKEVGDIKDLLINALIEGKIKQDEEKQVYIDYVKNNWRVE